MKIINKEEMSITYEDDKLQNKKVVYSQYNELQDRTIIFEDIINKETEMIKSTEIKGFFFGSPTIEHIEEYYGELKAEF